MLSGLKLILAWFIDVAMHVETRAFALSALELQYAWQDLSTSLQQMREHTSENYFFSFFSTTNVLIFGAS